MSTKTTCFPMNVWLLFHNYLAFISKGLIYNVVFQPLRIIRPEHVWTSISCMTNLLKQYHLPTNFKVFSVSSHSFRHKQYDASLPAYCCIQSFLIKNGCCLLKQVFVFAAFWSKASQAPVFCGVGEQHHSVVSGAENAHQAVCLGTAEKQARPVQQCTLTPTLTHTKPPTHDLWLLQAPRYLNNPKWNGLASFSSVFCLHVLHVGSGLTFR